jgi:hypothetical protein
MKPLAVDFAPHRGMGGLRRLPQRLRWFAGGAGALLLVLSSAAWLLAPAAEAGHMASGGERRVPPGVEEAQAVDVAVRGLNFPWLASLDVLEGVFESPADGVLLRAEADTRRAVIRVTGQARDAAAVLAIPARLRAMPEVTDAILLGQERQETATPHPVQFSLELRLKEST